MTDPGSGITAGLLKGLFYGCLLAISVSAGAVQEYSEKRDPCRLHDEQRQPFFGDLHVHTRYSLDASTQGTLTTPAQAYDFAKGQPLGIQPWDKSGLPLRSIRLNRPLDFAMVSDHAELFGEVHMCNTPGFQGHDSWQCALYRGWSIGAYYLFNFMSSMMASHMSMCGEDDALCKQASVFPWRDTQQAAETAYDRTDECSFTSFVGYEWSGMDPLTGGNLHRNVVFRNADVPDLPLSFIEEPSAERLWRGLDRECVDAPGACDAVVIPHNSNLSAGQMFTGRNDDGSPMTPQYAALRARYEPLLEVMQKGGSSECFYARGITQDELCAFEQQPIDNLAGFDRPPRPDTGFARQVLLQGLAIESEMHVNPYQFGFIASTDTHLGAAGQVSESEFAGHGGKGIPLTDRLPPGLPDLLMNNPGGLAVLWAEENSRDSLFEAIRRREGYATSGPRIISRFFAGWDYPGDLCERQDRIALAYASGTPMGGRLPSALAGAPRFMVIAQRDPGIASRPGTPLQRIQIIKGWRTNTGELKEAVFDVAGDTSNAAHVDEASCTSSGPGENTLCAVWTDETFDVKQGAYYYSRVLENPSCRWSQRICVAMAVDCTRPETVGEGLEQCCADGHREIIQERAWTSPIWYSPAPTPEALPAAVTQPPG